MELGIHTIRKVVTIQIYILGAYSITRSYLGFGYIYIHLNQRLLQQIEIEISLFFLLIHIDSDDNDPTMYLKLYYLDFACLLHIHTLMAQNIIRKLMCIENNQPVRLLVLARAYQPRYSVFLSQQTSTSRTYQPRNQLANILNINKSNL